MSSAEDPIECYLCFKADCWQKSEEPELDTISGLSSGGASMPIGWCHDYNNDGCTLYFCSKQHRDLWQRAKYLSWQAVVLLKEFAKTLKDVNH